MSDPNVVSPTLGSNFTSDTFWDFYEQIASDVKYVSAAYPRANGQVERANGMILDGLKKRLYESNSKKGGKWISKCNISKIYRNKSPAKNLFKIFFRH